MAFEHQVKRTLYVAVCECGNSVQVADSPPRERLFPCCGKWVPFEEVSYVGPEIKAKP